MNSSTHISMGSLFKVGLFTVLGLVLIGAMTVYVNHKPQWWRSCQLVHISVEDGTGLKSKSPIRSLGIEIGYLKTVELRETHVDLGICITAQVEVLPSTRAYLRGEGFLGDKFVELKPVKYTGPLEIEPTGTHSRIIRWRGSNPWVEWLALGIAAAGDVFVASAHAEDPAPAAPAAQPVSPSAPRPKREGREIPVGDGGQDFQHLVNRVDTLVNEITNLTTNLKSAINPDELRSTMKQLNRTLENASRTLSPEGGLNQTAQRTLGKLEDAIEQLRDMMTRVNKGEGSVGMLLNDPSYADELRAAMRNVNVLLSRVSTIRFVVDVGGEQLNAYNGGRGYFRLQIYPRPDYYYLIGISIDPRGKITQLDTTATTNGHTTTSTVRQLESTGILITGMLGKVLWGRLDLSLGALNGDGALSTQLRLGPSGREDLLRLRNDVYTRGSGVGIDDRITLTLKPFHGSPNPWSALYVKGGLEGFKTITTGGIKPWFYGAGIQFDDEDIKLLFTLR